MVMAGQGENPEREVTCGHVSLSADVTGEEA